jgi:Tfp pilus assembly protein PilN
MRIELNLATRPAENLRRFYVLAFGAIFLLLAVGALQAGAYFQDWASGRDTAREAAGLRAQLTELEAEQRRLERELQQPKAQEMIHRSNFLNGLILQKSVSWTGIFMDLEKLIPNNVQVLALRPELVEDGRVRLTMNVAGRSLENLIELLRRVEASDKFSSPVVTQEDPQGGSAVEGGVRMNLAVIYAQN